MTATEPSKRIAVGRLTGVFGIRGELKCRPDGAAPGALRAGAVYRLGPEPAARELRCSSVRRHHTRTLLAFDDVTTPEAARPLVGNDLYAAVPAAELEPGEYFDKDLTGLRLVDEAGRELGVVVGVQHYPAQDCLVVGVREQLVPLVSAFVRAIDLELGTIVTTLPLGLLEE